MADYGDATIRRHADGHLEVERADVVIGVSVALLVRLDAALSVDADGCLLLAGDPAYRYRPVRFASPEVVVCERVED